ncbi:hypothetical protein [Marinoscillum sp.]|uniref:hypothetical protein n=1 Tax=Marinoscillum sp. TaxID=2024838 RepID=UPI003BA8F07C
MQHFLYRRSSWVFIVFSVLALIAFWPGYFGRLSNVPNYRLHLHGIGMTLWCVLLIAQATLIRRNRFQLHSQLGKLSFLLVPFIIVSTVNLIHFQLARVQQVNQLHMYVVALIINALVAFMIIYGLGMYFRKERMVHGKYMLATIFPLFTPVTDRLIYQFMPGLVPLAPRIGNAPIVPFFGFLLADVLILGLIIWDWRANKSSKVFPFVLIVLLIYHYSVLNFYQFDFWKSFTQWFISMPFS